MRSVRAILLIVGFIAWMGAAAGPAVESWNTANGARVMFVHAPDLPMVDIRVVFDAGSARDGDRSGVSTLTNALLAEGAGPWNADQIAERLDDVGVRLSNDSLRDMGVVAVRSLTEDEVLAVALETLSEVLAAPHFAPDDLERQRQLMLVTLSKQKEKPGDIASRAFYEALYDDHPYARDPLGDESSVKSLTRDDVIAFHRRYYVARNAVIAIVGDLDRKAAEAAAEQITRKLPEGERAPALPSPPQAVASERRIAFDSAQTHLYVGAPGMSRKDPDYFPLYVGNHLLGGNGLVSTLSAEVREKRGLSYSVYSYFLPMAERGPFLMAAQTRNDRADETLNLLRQVLADFIEKGPEPQALDDAKRTLTGGFPLRIASNAKIVQYLAMMGFYDYPLDYLDTFVERVDAVTAEQVHDAFRRRIDPARLTLVSAGGATG